MVTAEETEAKQDEFSSPTEGMPPEVAPRPAPGQTYPDRALFLDDLSRRRLKEETEAQEPSLLNLQKVQGIRDLYLYGLAKVSKLQNLADAVS